MFDTIAFVADEHAIIAAEDTMPHQFYIVGATFTGAHFYSEHFDIYVEAAAIFEKYVGVVDYFGGGSVTMYEDAGYDVEVCQFVAVA